MVSFLLLLILSALPAAATPALDLRVVPDSESFAVIVSGTEPKASAGAFSGALLLYGSPSEISVTGVARATGDRLELSMKIRYRDVPEDWIKRFRAADFDYRLRGRVAGGSSVEWSGTRRWAEISVEKREDALSGFVKLGSIALTQFSLLESAARAEVTVRNPLSFPLKLASSSYRLFANGSEVGSGSTGEMTLPAAAETTLRLPIDLDHGQLLSAVGSALRSGGEIEGRLRGSLLVRLTGGDVPVPIDLSGRVSLLR
jgi:LEA14-like dessication related protein